MWGKGIRVPELTLLMCPEKQNPGTLESGILELEPSLHCTAAVGLWASPFTEDHDEEGMALPIGPACGGMLDGVTWEIKVRESTMAVLTSLVSAIWPPVHFKVSPALCGLKNY